MLLIRFGLPYTSAGPCFTLRQDHLPKKCHFLPPEVLTVSSPRKTLALHQLCLDSPYEIPSCSLTAPSRSPHPTMQKDKNCPPNMPSALSLLGFCTCFSGFFYTFQTNLSVSSTTFLHVILICLSFLLLLKCT